VPEVVVIASALVWVHAHDVQALMDVTYLEGVGRRAGRQEALTLLVFCRPPPARERALMPLNLGIGPSSPWDLPCFEKLSPGETD
jgi:hypothetical protein